jgi:predicted hydrocarbon binding protein
LELPAHCREFLTDKIEFFKRMFSSKVAETVSNHVDLSNSPITLNDFIIFLEILIKKSHKGNLNEILYKLEYEEALAFVRMVIFFHETSLLPFAKDTV